MRTPTEAEDAVQEALLRAWRRRHTCRTPDTPLPWLLQITRNEALRMTRRRGRVMEVDLAAIEPDAVADCEGEPAAETLDVRRAVGQLDARDRRLIELRYEQDLTQPEVADRLGIPEGTVKVRLFRLRERLRVALE